MSALEIIELILQLAPSGINLTTQILSLIKAIEAAFATAPAPVQQAVVSALAAHLSTTAAA